MESVRHCRLETYVSRPVRLPALNAYVPQILARRSYRGHLLEPAYIVRPAAIGARIKSADEVRELVGLEPDQLVIALLFDTDERIERFYDVATLQRLADAGYDLIVAPSYSLYWPRPRIHHLYNLTRSLAVCIALQALGAPAIPRVDWMIDVDVDRWASWIADNPAVEMVAIDAMTSRSSGWDQLLAGLERFDALTDRSLRFLVNGPTTPERWAQLYRIIDPTRLVLTDAHLATSPRTEQERLAFPGSPERSRGARHRFRVNRRKVEQERVALSSIRR